ncbi:MAG: isopentenyl-diphosphate Delta-isomerase [Candidatus Hodarchaeales archaeon]|jgi:isopentenyl-diphosphate delta-isomerase
MTETIILVDDKDNVIGFEDKLKPHQDGNLHRAFSIFIFNSKNELLIQKRAGNKYHSGGKWANTCCSHPRKGETLEEATNRRLKEEMGFTTNLDKNFEFIYKARVGDLIEHEYDHVFKGYYEGIVNPNPEEVEDYKWMTLDDIVIDIQKNPDNYGEWFKIALRDHLDKIMKMIE